MCNNKKVNAPTQLDEFEAMPCTFLACLEVRLT